MLGRLLDGVFAGLFALGDVVDEAGGGGRGLLDGVPNTEELRRERIGKCESEMCVLIVIADI